MSNSKKKNYKKRKTAAHIKPKTHVNVKEESKLEKILNEWLWLITLVVIVILAVLCITLIPMCNEGGACYECAQSCSEKAEDENEAGTVSDSDEVAPYIQQLLSPEDGEEIAVFETSAGTIKMRLFPEYAPETVANFKGLIGSDYYDGVIFHRVIKDFMIQGGDPTGTGAGGKTFSGNALPDENDNGLYHFRYAVSMANTGAANSGSSQFFIVQASDLSSFTVDDLMNTYKFDEGVAHFYEQFGGTPHLDDEFKSTNYEYYGVAHTVFGQVFEGFDVVNAIAAVEVDGNSKPVEDVVITDAYLTTYHAESVSGGDVSAADAQ